MDEILVRDNALPENVANSFQHNIYRLGYIISKDILANQMNNPGIVKDDNTFNTVQMVHRVFSHIDQRPQVNSGLEPVKYALNMMVEGFGYKIKDVLRLKFNMIQPHPDFKEGMYNTAHIDDEEMAQHFVLIYYPIDCDGDTYLFNEKFDKLKKPKKLTIHKRISPKRNRCIMFKGNRFHASANPMKNEMRIVLNCNFSLLEKEEFNENNRDTRNDPFKGTSIEGKD